MNDIDRQYEYFREGLINNLIDINIELLRDIHAKNYNGTDDNMPDAFNNWLTNFEYDELTDLLQQNAHTGNDLKSEDDFHNSIVLDARF